MKTFGVLMTRPMAPCLEEELSNRFHLFRLWQSTIPKLQFLQQNSHSIRAIVTNATAGVDSDMLDALPNVEIISTFSVGFDSIDLRKCRERGIKVTNTPDVLTDDVADLAIGLILSTLRKMSASDRFVRSRAWKEGNFELTSKFAGKAVGIVGLGRIGSAIARRAEAFSCPVSYFSRSEKPNSKYKYYSNLVGLAANSQVLVISCPLTEDTYHMVDREVIESLGAKGVLVNIARGSVVDEPELVSALLEGQLGGAGLDVFEHEPEPPEQLLELDNVVLSPHVGSDTEETCKAMADLVIGNLEAHLLNKPLLSLVI